MSFHCREIMPYLKEWGCWLGTPKQIIEDIISSGIIYNEYLNGIEELVKKETLLYKENEILLEDSDALLNDPESNVLYSYRNFTDDEGYSSWFVKQELPSLIRGSALISLFSIFESNIKFLCNELLSFTSLNISYDDLAGNRALDKLKIALKILGDEILDEGKSFHINKDLFKGNIFLVIKDAYIIRNCFAHANGQIKQTDKTAIEKNQRITNYFSIFDNSIIIKEGALIFISNSLRDFLNSILQD